MKYFQTKREHENAPYFLTNKNKKNMNDLTSVPRMAKCTNPKPHFHVNGQIGIPCGRREETKEAGLLVCERILIPTKGQEFRDKYSFTPTFKRNMQKKGLDWRNPDSLEAYRKLRKPLRVERVKNKKAKHDKALGGRSSKTKTVKK